MDGSPHETMFPLLAGEVIWGGIQPEAPETIKAATIMVTIIALYPFVQKFFIKGIMLGGVKG